MKQEEGKATSTCPFNLFVQILHEDNTFTNKLYPLSKVIEFVSMSDCHDEEMRVFYPSEYGVLEELQILGTWHDANDPLRIDLVDSRGETIFTGYGEDH